MDNFSKNWPQIKNFFSKPVFCLTMDIDWATDEIIEESLSIFRQYDIPVTPFITHKSKIIEKHFKKPSLIKKVGLHPNFLPESTHGKNYKEQINHVISLWPDARCFRSHSFFDSYYISTEFARRGFPYDANLCMFLQKDAFPFKHASSLIRFPTTWEDDHCFYNNFPFELSAIKDFISAPGLKLFNFHPIHIALNTNNVKTWEEYKKKKNKNSYKDLINKGIGTKSLLIELLNYIKDKNINCYFLDDLYNKIISLKTNKTFKFIPLGTYQKLSNEDRNKFIQKRWNHIDKNDIYTTSRDINLKELEISFIKKNIKPGKILDIGCGNGYTLFSLAEEFKNLPAGKKADLYGIDFSKKSLQMAEELLKKIRKKIKCIPKFILGDVSNLPFKKNELDYVFSERCLLNLPSKKHQQKTILEVHRVLKKGGEYIMIEGTRNGLRKLNDLRKKVGLLPIPDRAKNNITSLKFEEKILQKLLKKYFSIKKIKYFSSYYFISRIIHPLFVVPQEPKFDAKINFIGRNIEEKLPPITDEIGHIVCYILKKK